MTFINNKCPRLPLAVFSRSFQCSVNTRTAAGSQEGSGLYCDSEMYRGWGRYMQTKHSERFFDMCSTDTDARIHCYVDAHALKVCLEHRAMETCALCLC